MELSGLYQACMKWYIWCIIWLNFHKTDSYNFFTNKPLSGAINDLHHDLRPGHPTMSYATYTRNSQLNFALSVNRKAPSKRAFRNHHIRQIPLTNLILWKMLWGNCARNSIRWNRLVWIWYKTSQIWRVAISPAYWARRSLRTPLWIRTNSPKNIWTSYSVHTAKWSEIRWTHRIDSSGNCKRRAHNGAPRIHQEATVLRSFPRWCWPLISSMNWRAISRRAWNSTGTWRISCWSSKTR